MVEEIGDYALVCDCESTALISPSGCIDWLFWPRSDSLAIFFELLDDRGDVRSRCVFKVHSRRVAATLTKVRCAEIIQHDGPEFVLTDAMPIYTSMKQRALLTPEHEIVRTLVCKRANGGHSVGAPG
jgi:GH15 family glucan-1,4-alpha-glucosidase